MNIIRLLTTAILLIGLSCCLYAQSGLGDVRGFVYDQDTGEPIIFTTVLLQGTNHAVATDINGFFSINRVPAGSYTLSSTYVGYDTTRIALTIKSGEILNQKI